MILSRQSGRLHRNSSYGWFLLVFLCLAGVDVEAQQLVPLNSIAAIRNLKPNEADRAIPVDLTGVVVSQARFKNLLFIQDQGQGLVVYAPGTNVLSAIGDRVRLRGFTVFQDGLQVVARDVETLESGVGTPPPRKLTMREANNLGNSMLWIEVGGVIKSINSTSSRTDIVLRHNRQTLDVRVRPPIPHDRLLYSIVRIRGMLIPWEQMNVDRPGNVLWVTGLASIQNDTPYAWAPFDREEISITEFLEIQTNALWNWRPKIRGRAQSASTNARSFVLHDGTNKVRVATERPEFIRGGDMITAVGFSDADDQGLFMSHAEIRIRTATTNGLRPVITSLDQVRRLGTDTLTNHPPARLDGTITYYDYTNKLYFIQSGDAGVPLANVPSVDGLKTGVRVLVDGTCEPGEFAPQVNVHGIKLVGPGKIPAGVPANTAYLQAGRLDGLWCFGEGLIRTAKRNNGNLEATINRYGTVIPITIHGGGDLDPDAYIDAWVNFQAVGKALISRQGFVVGSRLLVPAPRFIKITSEPQKDPFNMPVRKIEDFLGYFAEYGFLRINRVEGVVTLAWPGKFYVEDETGSIEVRTDETYNLRVGDKVNVIGFPVLTSSRPILEDARIKRIGKGTVDAAPRTSANRVLTHEMNGRRASLTGILLSKTQGVREYRLMFDDGDITLPIVLRRRIGPLDLESYEIGSRLRVTGICELSETPGRKARDVRLLVDSARDIEVLERPPFLTTTKLIAALGGMALIIAGSLGWVAFLSKRVAQTQSRFATAFRASPVPVAIMNRAERRIIDVNDSFVDKFEYSRKKLIARRFDDLRICLDSGLLERVDKKLADRDSVRAIDCELRSASGKARYVLLSVEAIDIDDEQCLLFIFQDVTERLALMDQLRESQKMEAVGQLAAGVAHDFNNLLTIIRGNCDILKEVGKEDEELTEISGELSDATNRASDLTRQLLAFSRKQVMQPRIADLNSILASSLKMVKRLLGEGVTVNSHLAKKELPVFADPGMLDQVLVNFVVNARDAMDGKGTLTIRSGVADVSQEDLEKHVEGRAGPHVHFSVQDTGIGIDPETLKRIFEPFFTTKEVGKGTGLGLATVYGIARQHRGWIDVRSVPGEGSTFSVYLPMAEQDEQEDTVIVATEQNLGGNENILVTEDETAVRRLVCRTLERVGYTVYEAPNAEAAEELWNLHKLDIDLLLTDLVMPGGKSGFELAHELTAQRPDLPVVYMSGYSAEFVEKGSDLDMGVNFVPKPFTRKAILEIVRNRLDAKIA